MSSTSFTIKPIRGLIESDNLALVTAVSSAAGCYHIAHANGELYRVFPDENQVRNRVKFVSQSSPGGGGLMALASGPVSVKVDISSVYSSGSAFHTLVGTSTGDVFYLTLDSTTAVSLPKLKGHVITAVCWMDETLEGAAEVLIGTQSGKLVYVSLEQKKDKLVKVLGEVPERIVDVVIFSKTQCLVSTPCALYAFAGEKLGANHHQLPVLMFESPAEPCLNSKLIIHSEVPSSVGPGTSSYCVSWLSGVGVVTAKLPLNNAGSSLMTGLVIVPHSSALGISAATLVGKKSAGLGGKPRGLAVTEYHYMIQFESKIVLVSRISLGPVASVSLAQYGGMMSPLAAEGSVKSMKFITFTESKIYQVVIGNESADAWKHWVKRRNYSAALASTTSKPERAFILKHEADFLLDHPSDAQDYSKASNLYAMAMKEDAFFLESFFNDIVTRLEKADKRALVKFVSARMDVSSEQEQEREVVQMSVLFIYCVHLFVDLLLLDPESTRNDFYAFIEQRHSALDRQCIETMFELLESVGLFEEMVNAAAIVGDNETAIRMDLALGNYQAILKRIQSATPPCDEELIMNLSPLLFRFCPEDFCSFLLKIKESQFRKFSYCLASCGALTRDHKDQAISVLSHWLLRSNYPQFHPADKQLLSLLIQLSCEIGTEESVSQLINSIHSKVSGCFFDSEFALRAIKHRGLKSAEIVLLSVSGLDLLATKAALNLHTLAGLELAQSCAWRSPKVETRRSCWVEILKHIAGQPDVTPEKLIEVFRESEVVEITDLLPLLSNVAPDSIDGVRNEIRNQVEEINAKGQATKAEIGNYQDALKLIRSDVMTKLNECVILSHTQKCDICFKLVFSEKFIAFNCGHCFHEECAKEALAKRIVSEKASVCRNCCLCGPDSLLLEQLFEPFVDDSLDSEFIAAWSICSH